MSPFPKPYEKHLDLLVALNNHLHIRLWEFLELRRTYRQTLNDQGHKQTLNDRDRYLEADPDVKSHKCRISNKFLNIPVSVGKEKRWNDTSEDISNEKRSEILEGLLGIVEAERARSSREVDLLPIEEKNWTI